VRLRDYLHRQAHERPHIGGERAVGARDQHDLVLAAEARDDLGDARVERAALALELLEQLHLVDGFERGHRIDRAVQGNRHLALIRFHPVGFSGRRYGAGRLRRVLQGVEADLVGVGEGGLLARDRAHADTLLDVEASRLDDAFLEAPALVARVLEVEVRVVDLVRGERAEHPLELGGIEVQLSLLLTRAGSEPRTSRSLPLSISASATPSPSASSASTSPQGSTIIVWP